MKLKILLFLFLSQVFISAQVVTAVAPLKPGNKWLYSSRVLTQYSFLKFEVLDSVKVINNIPFFVVLTGENLSYTTYMGMTPDNFYARYDEVISDSLYTYFKLNPKKGDIWDQQWKNGVILFNTIVDTFKAPVFGHNTLIYIVDRLTIENGDTSTFGGSREFWTKEFGMVNGRYEAAEDILIGCVIDGVLYGDTTVVGIEDVDKLPNDFTLYQNYPNPFNPTTIIDYKVANESIVQLKIFDILGREVAELVNETKLPGTYKVNFDANDLSSGVYIYRITASNNGRILFTDAKKMILLR